MDLQSGAYDPKEGASSLAEGSNDLMQDYVTLEGVHVTS